MRLLGRLVLIVTFIFLLPFFTYVMIAQSESAIDTPQEKVIYNLPYPGILPDHPLYPIKALRDKLTDFLTRDYLKKADLYLLYSDKRAAMSLALAKKGKNQQAIDTFSKGEKYFLKIPVLLKTAKQQGGQAPSAFVETLKLSNAKHHEMITELIKIMPQGLNESISQLSDLNSQAKEDLNRLP